VRDDVTPMWWLWRGVRPLVVDCTARRRIIDVVEGVAVLVEGTAAHDRRPVGPRLRRTGRAVDRLVPFTAADSRRRCTIHEHQLFLATISTALSEHNIPPDITCSSLSLMGKICLESRLIFTHSADVRERLLLFQRILAFQFSAFARVLSDCQPTGLIAVYIAFLFLAFVFNLRDLYYLGLKNNYYNDNSIAA